jgi:alkanesulfonate monooxygenase SsuD/methylene tetrahydromethanopterin reductase-like flavin-dependent oxidoreductase (luciferase family)
VPSVEEALAYPYSPPERARLGAILAQSAIGSPQTVRQRLTALARAHGVDELVVVTICHDPAARQRSYELLAEAFALPPREAAGPAPRARPAATVGGEPS